ncbi:hypothetical protein AGOR_G00226150 [Albula goreensis]|uniref:UBX domain-containing protein n=1 Tax=Albula goreensis TaxID=1534307 RepID=A0A8T3CH78_9TELE|nr:hypothetical protein AGOR_G00226150 [Albula goreensis]
MPRLQKKPPRGRGRPRTSRGRRAEVVLPQNPTRNHSALSPRGRWRAERSGVTRDTPLDCSSPGTPSPRGPKPNTDTKPIDREPLVYHMESGVRRHSSSGTPPEDFFEVTVEDVKKRLAQLQSGWRPLEKTPLMTQALILEKIQRYPKVTLRIHFPDRHVLQGSFRPLETVDALRTFVRSYLADPKLGFYLFTAPPKKILDDPTATLFEANLFPTAVIYFGSDVETERYLQDKLLDSSTSTQKTRRLKKGCTPRSLTPLSTSPGLEGLFPPPAASNAPANQQGAAAGRPRPQTNSQAPEPVRADPSKVPKWLKLPGKR